MLDVILMKFGSHLYGTSTPTSDVDIKGVFIPPARDILLGKTKGVVSTKRPKQDGEKNYAGEVDEERYSLAKFLHLLLEGQTAAIEMIFAPDWAFIGKPGSVWRELQRNREKMFSRQHKAFIQYAYKQASKYGVKGSRVAAARGAAILLARISEMAPNAKLAEYAQQLEDLAVEDDLSQLNVEKTG